MVIHPSGKYLYVANPGQGENDVSLFDINSDGTVSEVTPRTTVGTLPFLLDMDPAGNYLYCRECLVEQYFGFLDRCQQRRAHGGCRVSVSDSICPPRVWQLSPSGNFLYVSAPSSPTGVIAVFSVTSGVLSSSPVGLTFTADNDPAGDRHFPQGFVPLYRELYRQFHLDLLYRFVRNADTSPSVASCRPLSASGCADRGSDGELSLCSESRIQQCRDLFDYVWHGFSCRNYRLSVRQPKHSRVSW